jgi:hypothetical protein
MNICAAVLFRFHPELHGVNPSTIVTTAATTPTLPRVKQTTLSQNGIYLLALMSSSRSKEQ